MCVFLHEFLHVSVLYGRIYVYQQIVGTLLNSYLAFLLTGSDILTVTLT